MPITAAFVDQLRKDFGAEAISLCIREGLRDGHFCAIEAGQVVGRPPREAYERHGLEAPPDAVPDERGYPALPASVRANLGGVDGVLP